VLLPTEKNKITVRFENLADLVDDFGIAKAEPWKLDIYQFALSLYQDVNPNATPDKINIEHLDLQGVHPIKEASRFQWLAQASPIAESPKSELPK